ncbi:hypothetical protein SKAU_G00386810 [Synaphobranchus kaupii]|uniref:Uncharacterized protein n=1 Tax=Synaphobranchus kaupii TaxID=118154 RepID=A0A9Q1ID64_SYNKA|nr:hypothetical protein SKAU_G00386810 [Synaphobranchus kaupii]
MRKQGVGPVLKGAETEEPAALRSTGEMSRPRSQRGNITQQEDHPFLELQREWCAVRRSIGHVNTHLCRMQIEESAGKKELAGGKKGATEKEMSAPKAQPASKTVATRSGPPKKAHVAKMEVCEEEAGAGHSVGQQQGSRASGVSQQLQVSSVVLPQEKTTATININQMIELDLLSVKDKEKTNDGSTEELQGQTPLTLTRGKSEDEEHEYDTEEVEEAEGPHGFKQEMLMPWCPSDAVDPDVPPLERTDSVFTNPDKRYSYSEASQLKL